MEPTPPSILKCPHCAALYTQTSWFLNRKLNKDQEQWEALKWGQHQIRHMIWQKLNDEIREGGYDGLSKNTTPSFSTMPGSYCQFFQWIRLSMTKTFFIWKAELHSNLGEFIKSFNSLRQVTDRSLLKSQLKMIFLNLMRNRKLVPLWADRRGLSRRIKLWWSWIW